VRTEIDMPGTLYVREGHGIGSYDAFLIPPAALGYRRGSAPLPDALEESFKAQLEQTLLDATRAAEIPTVNAPGACVMIVALGVLEVDVASRDSADPAGELTMAMEFRDSLSGDALLRYEAPQTVANDGSGDPPAEQIMRRFDGMVRDMQLAGALRAAGLAEEATRPECDGLLAKRGQALSSPSVASGSPDLGASAPSGQ
jgi:hypothetical protein